MARGAVVLAIFAVVLVGLLADGSQGTLNDAEAQKGAPGAEGVAVVEQGAVVPTEVPVPVEPEPPPVPPEPVKEEPPAPPAEPVEPAEPPASGGEGSVDDGAAQGEGGDGSAGGGGAGQADGDGSQASGGDGSQAGGGEGQAGGGDGQEGGGGDGQEGGGDEGDDPEAGAPGEDRGAEEPPSFGAPADRSNRSLRKPAGGAKGPEPAADALSGASPQPEPAGRGPLVVEPGAGAGADPDSPGQDPGGPPETVGDGEGRIVDSSAPAGGGNNPDNELTARAGGDDGAGATADPNSLDSVPDDSSTLSSGTELAAVPEAGDAPGAGAGEGDQTGNGGAGDRGGDSGREDGPVKTVTKEVEKLVAYVPDSIKAALAALAALSLLLGVGYLLAGMRARRLGKQRSELLQEVGLLQSALLPPVPDKVGALRTSVAYRPADGPGAGGDFYDVLPLPGARVGFILGDVSGHGRGALARTAFMRYTLRAYLEAGLEPRVALQVAGRVIDDNLGGDFATVLLAVHDPETGSLTYATAGHPAPIVVGPQPHDPVTAGSSPPIGVGVRTGLRQTTVPLVPGSVACLFTDGLMEARTPEGILGRERLAELLEELGDEATARRLIESVAAESSKLSDDMAAVIAAPTAGVTAGLFRTEQLELTTRELEGPIARRFLLACGLSPHEVEDAEHDARLLAERFGGVVLHVVFGNRLRVEVLPRNVESIEAASRRVSAGIAR